MTRGTGSMKIVHVTPHAGIGGDWTVIKGLEAVFSANHHDITIMGAAVSGRVAKGHDIEINQGLRGVLTSLGKLKVIGRDTNILHAHSLSAVAFCIAAKATRCRAARIVYTMHWAVIPGKFKQSLARLMLGLVDTVHVYSVEMQRFVRQNFGVPQARIALTYVGVDPSKFLQQVDYDPSERRRALGIPAVSFLILYVGRLAPEKGVSHLIECLSKLPQEDVALLVVGSGDLECSLKELSQDLSVADKVTFLSHSENVADFYRLADILVLPSLELETFGLVVIEAAMCALPSIRSDLPGAHDQIVHGHSGLMYPVGDKEILLDLLTRVVEGEFELKTMGQRAQQHAIKNFTLDRMYQNFLSLYRSHSG
jgi:glycosyltransferase involved in cell wall biosynthesis